MSEMSWASADCWTLPKHASSVRCNGRLIALFMIWWSILTRTQCDTVSWVWSNSQEEEAQRISFTFRFWPKRWNRNSGFGSCFLTYLTRRTTKYSGQACELARHGLQFRALSNSHNEDALPSFLHSPAWNFCHKNGSPMYYLLWWEWPRCNRRWLSRYHWRCS